MRVVLEPDAAELEAAFTLRYRVFVDEQQVPLDLERDAYDQTASHVVVFDGAGAAVATGRVRRLAGEAKVERVAVDRERRGEGLGRLVMDALEERARDLGVARLKLAAQRSAIAFYERLGYEGYGADFEEAGIQHRWMRKGLTTTRTSQ